MWSELFANAEGDDAPWYGEGGRCEREKSGEVEDVHGSFVVLEEGGRPWLGCTLCVREYLYFERA